MKSGRAKAFTLIELLIALSLFAVLAGGILLSGGGGAITSLYRWETHTVSPAFTVEALDSSSGALTGEKLVVSLRGLTTRVRKAP